VIREIHTLLIDMTLYLVPINHLLNSKEQLNPSFNLAILFPFNK